MSHQLNLKTISRKLAAYRDRKLGVVVEKPKRQQILHAWKGEHVPLIDIAIMENVDYYSLRSRVFQHGLTLEQAVAYCEKRELQYHERAKSRGGSKKPVKAGWERKKKSVSATGHRDT